MPVSVKKTTTMTKLFTLLLAAVCCTNNTYSQIKKGTTSIGGQVAYYSTAIDHSSIQRDESGRQAVFNISAGRAFKENNVLGADIGYRHISNNSYFGNSPVDVKYDYYSVGLFYRQYRKLARDLYFFIEPGAGYYNSKQIDTDLTNVELHRVKQSGGYLTLMPGISYRLIKKLYVEVQVPRIAAVEYLSIKETMPTDNIHHKQFLFTSSLNSSPLAFLGVGFRFIF
jgi:hypothetical protein